MDISEFGPSPRAGTGVRAVAKPLARRSGLPEDCLHRTDGVRKSHPGKNESLRKESEEETRVIKEISKRAASNFLASSFVLLLGLPAARAVVVAAAPMTMAATTFVAILVIPP